MKFNKLFYTVAAVFALMIQPVVVSQSAYAATVNDGPFSAESICGDDGNVVLNLSLKQRGPILGHLYYKTPYGTLIKEYSLDTAVLDCAPAPYEFPSTNEDNTSVNGPHVRQVASRHGEVELEFVNPFGYLACFEYRIDGGAPVDLGVTLHDTSIGVIGDAHPVVAGDMIYPQVCLSGVIGEPSPYRYIFTANEKVDIRLAVGGERDWDFDWTPFYVEAENDTDIVDDDKVEDVDDNNEQPLGVTPRPDNNNEPIVGFVSATGDAVVYASIEDTDTDSTNKKDAEVLGADETKGEALSTQAEEKKWSLVNALLAGVVVAASLVVLAGVRESQGRGRVLRMLTIVPAVAAAVVVVLVEDFSAKLGFVSGWTLLFVAIAAAQGALVTSIKSANK